MFSVNCTIISNAVVSIQQSSHEAKKHKQSKYIINLSRAFPVSFLLFLFCIYGNIFGVLVYGKFCNVEKTTVFECLDIQKSDSVNNFICAMIYLQLIHLGGIST